MSPNSTVGSPAAAPTATSALPSCRPALVGFSESLWVDHSRFQPMAVPPAASRARRACVQRVEPNAGDAARLDRRHPDLGFGTSHYRFRNRRTEYLSESGVKRTNGSTKRQCNRTEPDLGHELLIDWVRRIHRIVIQWRAPVVERDSGVFH